MNPSLMSAVLAGALALCAAEVTDLQLGPVAIKMGQPYYSSEIMPTPRQVEYRDEYLPLADGAKGVWKCHVTNLYSGPARPLMDRLLAARLGSYAEQFEGLSSTPDGGQGSPLVFCLASDERAESYVTRYGLAARAGELQDQGYILLVRPEGVLCLGRDNAGMVNGLASLLQLVHVREGRLQARCADVFDWPTFSVRYTSEYWLPGEGFLDWMMLQKINGFGACYPGMRWQGLTDVKRKGLKTIGDYIRTYETMHFMVQFHIGGRGGCPPLDCGDPEQVKQLLGTIAETIELASPQHVMICYDDVAPELQPEEKKVFQRPAQAHGAVMQQVYETVKALSPDTVVSFCSPYYQGKGHRRWRDTNPRLAETLQYMADLKVWPNRDIRIVWTGPVTESRRITLEDIDRYLELVGPDRKLVYWDNTWHYHQPMRNFHARYLEGFVDHCADGTSYINVNGVQPIGRFFAATANDYYWNPEAFDSVRARRHAVAQFMGPQAVPAAESFYKLRGEDYFVFFSRDVDLEAFKAVLADLEAASIGEALPKMAWAVYEGVVKTRQDGK